MVDVIISFDSEDYLTPEAADAELWWSEALASRGIRGCWQLVGEFVRSLIRSGRTDVIESLKQHEIDYHTDFHSRNPTHPEAVCDLSLQDGIGYVLRTETPGLTTIAQTFGTWPVSYCSPGDSWTPATLLAMAQMGLKVFCNDKLHGFQETPYCYCGLLVGMYNLDFQDFYEDPSYEEGRFEAAFNDLFASRDGDGVIVLCTHPTRLATAAFWDEVFADGKRPALADWHPASLRSPAEIELIKARCSRWLDWLVARDDIRFIDFATFHKERSFSTTDLSDLLANQNLPANRPGDLPLKRSDDSAFMPSSVLDGMTYDWLPYPKGFTGQALVEQAAALSWTACPVERNTRAG